MRIELGADPAEALARVAQRFAFASRVQLAEGNDPVSTAQLVACLAALPDRSWPAVEDVYGLDELPAATVQHAARLCPGLRSVTFRAHDGAELAAALEGLAPVAGTLAVLELGLRGDEAIEQGAMLRAAEALGQLSGLQRLDVCWRWAPGVGRLLARRCRLSHHCRRWRSSAKSGRARRHSSRRWACGLGP